MTIPSPPRPAVRRAATRARRPAAKRTDRLSPIIGRWLVGVRALGAKLGQRLAPAIGLGRALARRLSVVTAVGWLAAVGGLSLLLVGLGFGWVEAVAIGLIGVTASVIALLWTIGSANYTATIEVDSTRVRVGDQVLGRVNLTNQGRRGLSGSMVELPVGRAVATLDVPALANGEMHEQIFSVPTKRRAVITLGPVRSVKSDPLGLIRRIRQLSDRIEVYVHPQTVLVDPDTTGLLRDIEGVVTRDLSSSDVAFHALRDYVPGDDRRAVHWRSTARLGRLIVRQFEETRKTHLLVVLSTDVADYTTEDEFEVAVSAAASLILQAAREERQVTLCTQAGAVTHRTPALLLDQMCRLELRPGHGLAALTMDAANEVPDATVAALISGPNPSPTELRLARSHVPIEIRCFALRSAQSQPVAMRQIGSLPVLDIPTLADLPRALRGLR